MVSGLGGGRWSNPIRSEVGEIGRGGDAMDASCKPRKPALALINNPHINPPSPHWYQTGYLQDAVLDRKVCASPLNNDDKNKAFQRMGVCDVLYMPKLRCNSEDAFSGGSA